MKLSKDDNILRTIIMENYDNPDNKIDERISDSSYLSYHNKSTSCIDDIEIFIKLENNIIKDAKFFGVGCAISTASTNIFCDLIKEKNLDYAKNLLKQYINMIEGNEYNEDIVDELIAFYKINKQGNRIKCALIGANALNKIIKDL